MGVEEDCSGREVRSSLQAQTARDISYFITSPRKIEDSRYSKQDKVLNLQENLHLLIKY
jgi:hypothetical protein